MRINPSTTWPLIFITTSSVFAQATENAVTAAQDAFGFSNGDENVGIYSEQSVRGFNLEAAGNYRINGRYFVKSSGTSNFFLEKKTVRIGYNTFAVDLPGPSGVVDFKLRDPAEEDPNLLTVGLAEHGSPYMDFLYKYRSSDNSLSAAAGLGLEYENIDHQGGKSNSWLLAGTMRWNITDHTKLQFFGGEYSYRRQSQFRVRTDGTFLPTQIERGKYLGQNWAEEKGERRIAGLLWNHNTEAGWQFGGSAVFSQEDPTEAYTQLFTINTSNMDEAQSTLITAPHQKYTAWSGEVTMGKVFKSGDVRHKLNMHGRLRFSRNRFGGEEMLNLGNINFGTSPIQSKESVNAYSSNLLDKVAQWGVGLAYQMVWATHTKLTAGVLRSDYTKSFISNMSSNTNESKLWLYNAAITTKVLPTVEAYASYSRGLEEAGTAPSSAANPNSVLNAVVVTQREIGIKTQFGNGINLVIAGFDTRKPYAGLNSSTNIFGLFGTVKHQGIEASLSGEISPGLSVIFGGVVMKASLSGVSAEASKPVAVPSSRLIANIDYKLPNFPKLSFDMGVESLGKQAASSRTINRQQLLLERQTTINAGMRYKLRVGKQHATLRFQALNLFNKFHWQVNSSETFDYNAGRRFRLILTTEL